MSQQKRETKLGTCNKTWPTGDGKPGLPASMLCVSFTAAFTKQVALKTEHSKRDKQNLSLSIQFLN
jgi:hypothetical protein